MSNTREANDKALQVAMDTSACPFCKMQRLLLQPQAQGHATFECQECGFIANFRRETLLKHTEVLKT